MCVCVVVSCGCPYSWVERWPKDLVDSLDVILAGEVLTRKKNSFKLISAHDYYTLQKKTICLYLFTLRDRSLSTLFYKYYNFWTSYMGTGNT